LFCGGVFLPGHPTSKIEIAVNISNVLISILNSNS
jgi:hypothetical protein